MQTLTVDDVYLLRQGQGGQKAQVVLGGQDFHPVHRCQEHQEGPAENTQQTQPVSSVHSVE